MSSSNHDHSAIHPASLVPTATHNPMLLHLLRQSVSRDMVEFVASKLMSVLEMSAETAIVHSSPGGTSSSQLSPGTSCQPAKAQQPPASLLRFMEHLVHVANVGVGALLTTTIYLERLREKMPIIQEAMSNTIHRIFLATLIVTAKYLNDSAPKNCHWAKYACIFELEQINLMEKQLLFLLDYDLRFREDEACSYFAPFMRNKAQVDRARATAIDKVARASVLRAKAQQAQDSSPSPTSQQDACAKPPSSKPLSSSNIASTVKGLAKRISTAHLPVIRVEASEPSPVRSTFSTDSSSSAGSSEMGSLLDDTGSSSGSSSGWLSSDSDSEAEERAPPHIYSRSSERCDYSTLPSTRDPNYHISSKKYPLYQLPIRSYIPRATRSRNPSDTSSVRTITPSSPPHSLTYSSLSTLHSRRSSKRVSHLASSESDSFMQDGGISSSVTMPTIPPRAGGSGGFLSRMWGVAKGHYGSGQEKPGHSHSQSHSGFGYGDPLDSRPGQGHSAFKRLVLAHSRTRSHADPSGLDV